MRRALLGLALVLLSPAAVLSQPAEKNAAQAADKNAPQAWGDIAVTFRHDGPAPAAKPLDIAKAGCIFNPPLVDEKWGVEPKTRGVKKVLLTLVVEKGVTVPIHPAFEKS